MSAELIDLASRRSPREIAEAVLANGYSVVPVARGTKGCRVIGWPRWCAAPPTAQDVAAWRDDVFGGVGIACGARTVGIDVDTIDAGECDRVEKLARETLGDTPLVRVGQPPKRLLVYRAVELADSMSVTGLDVIGMGRQFVAFAVHPKTNRPYSWGAASPLTLKASELPGVTNAAIRAFVVATGLPAIETEGGGRTQAIVRDGASGLVVDGREAHLLLCVLQTARTAPDASPEAWAESAWRDFSLTTDLITRPSKLSERDALRKARYLAKRIAGGRVEIGEQKLTVDDFWMYSPQHSYICTRTRDHWPATSVDARASWPIASGKAVRPSRWIDARRAVDQMTWAPGLPEIIEGQLVAEGGWTPSPNARVFNLYRPPSPPRGDASAAGRWLELLETLYPEEHAHLLRWFAARVQRPGDKINHGLVLGGAPGIGKDTLLAAIKRAVGYWNMREVAPATLVEPFNDWAKSVILRVSEAKDLGGSELSAANRYSLYEHMKVICAAPPEVLRVNEKHVRQYAIPNVLGVVVTTNYEDGLYLPADDRRFLVAWSERTRDEFNGDFWRDFWEWYDGGGFEHVATHLNTLDLAGFDLKAPPPMTAGKLAMIDAGRDVHLGPIGEALDKMRAAGLRTDAVTPQDLVAHGDSAEVYELLTSAKNARNVPRVMAVWGYVKVISDAKDGRWSVDGTRVPVYARRDLTHAERLAAVRALCASTRTATDQRAF